MTTTLLLILCTLSPFMVLLWPAVAQGSPMSDKRREGLWGWYHNSGAECIAKHEGGWESNTGNGYFGRFQANVGFQKAYGYNRAQHIRFIHYFHGYAHRWDKVDQILMARHGYNARDWYPWLNTAKACGLL